MNIITQGLGPDIIYDAPDPVGTLLTITLPKEPVPPENGNLG